MFDMSMSEMLVVVVVTLVAIGPRDLPRALHTVGRWVRRARAMASEFHRHIDEMVHEVELDEFRRKAAELNRKTLTNVLENAVDSDGKLHRSLTLHSIDGIVKNTPPDKNSSDERTAGVQDVRDESKTGVQRTSEVFQKKIERMQPEKPSSSQPQQPPPAS